MNVMTMQSLEYEKIKGHVREYAMSFIGRQHVDDMQPLTDVVTIRTLLDEAEEAQRILATGGSVSDSFSWRHGAFARIAGYWLFVS